MRSNKKLCICIIFLVLAVSCNFSSIKYNPKYSYSGKVSDPSLALCFRADKIKINYIGEVADEFGTGDKNELILNYFSLSVLKNFQTKTIFKKAGIDCESDSIKWNVVVVKKNYDVPSKTVLFPAVTQPIRFVKSTPDFAIWISDITLKRIIYSQMSWEAGFIIWDNSAQKVMSYGYVSVTESVNFVFTKENWDNISSSFFSALISKLPRGMVIK